jgi:hypothetical protein
MLHPKVRRLLTVLALVLVLAAACPALAAPGPHSQAPQPPVASLSLLDRLLDWLGFPAAENRPGIDGVFEKSTTTTITDPGTSSATRTTLNRGAMVDPNG